MGLVLARIDDRLIHGQVTVGWARHLKANRVIVANDEAARNSMMRTLFKLAVPRTLRVSTLTISEACHRISDGEFAQERAILLVSLPQDLLKLITRGIKLDSVNVGAMRFMEHKRSIGKAVYVDDKDVQALQKLSDLGIELEMRAVPTEPKVDLIPILAKFRMKGE